MFSVPTTDLEAYADGLVRKINAKLEQLQIEGVTTHDEEIIESGRLKFVWDDPVQFSAITTWRHRRARSAYTKVQNANAHLFLAMVLAVTPTDCAKTRFEGVLDHILRWNDIKACHFRLSVEARKLFESVAAQQGYSGSCGYLSFMKGLFPPDRYQAGERQIQFMYSNIPLENIGKLFEIMRKGVETSDRYISERQRGERISGSITALIPTGEKDCCFTVVVGRDDMMRGLRQLGLAQLNL